METTSREVVFEFLDRVGGAVALTVWCGQGTPAPMLSTTTGDVRMSDCGDGSHRAELRPSGGRFEVRVAEPSALVGVGDFFPCGRVYRNAFFRIGAYDVFWSDGRLVFQRSSAWRTCLRRCRFFMELALSGREGARKAVLVRIAVAFLRLFKRRPLWLVSDRMDAGGDNGEALFRHLRENRPAIDARFVVSSKSPVFAGLRRLGPVIACESPLRKLLTLLADCLISSQAERMFSNPFAGHSEPYRDLLAKIPLVFLQHGVIKDDLSAVLSRRRRNFAGFVVSAKREMASVVNGAYGYGREAVWLTGLPRFDLLERRTEKRIAIMPTWRLGLFAGQEPGTGRWLLKAGFPDTEFCGFYRSLLSNVRLLEACRQHGYRISFLLHPNLMAARDFFTPSDVVEIGDGAVSYRSCISDASLLVTDYSSTAFDFAYLRKPVVYAQFDGDAFFGGGHTYGRGYFDYARDGFGDVTTTLDATVASVVGLIETGCRLKPEYRRRMDGFFAFSGDGNCYRVTERILWLAGGVK